MVTRLSVEFKALPKGKVRRDRQKCHAVGHGVPSYRAQEEKERERERGLSTCVILPREASERAREIDRQGRELDRQTDRERETDRQL